eukprot:GFYU01002395.1.p1 GENE.GFYU01002395.1~~GFYU01002395.1.p1  ORF type:complete len:399 (+),score=79.78 GFYU01002395.1:107-1303(+)
MVVLVRMSFSHGAFFPGDYISFFVEIENVKKTPKTVSLYNIEQSDDEEDSDVVLDWVTVQMHGQQIVDPHHAVIQPGKPRTIASETAFPNMKDLGHHGISIFANQPTIVLCDNSLKIGERRVFCYRGKLPNNLPPTFTGTGMKFNYVVSVGVQANGRAAQLAQLPFRVLNPLGGVLELDWPQGYPDWDFDVKWKEIGPDEDAEEVTADMEAQENDDTNKWMVSEEFYERHQQPHFFNISLSDDHIVRICLNKSAYRLGELVCGSFDFTKRSAICHGLSVKLEVEEEIDEAAARGATRVFRTVINEHYEYTRHISKTNFSFFIPIHGPAEFATDLVKLRWCLRFDFVVEFTSETGDTHRTETLQWCTPIRVLCPTMPRTGGIYPLEKQLKLTWKQETLF